MSWNSRRSQQVRLSGHPRAGVLLSMLLSLVLTHNIQAGPVLVFDYTYDTTGFFTAERREVMELAADAVNRWVDSLSAISESGSNAWVGQFVRPDTGVGVIVPGSQLNVPADVVRVFAGARDLGAANLAVAHKNGAVAFGTPEWIAQVNYRGQTPGPPYLDYGPWGGSIAFNTAIEWYSQLDPTDINNSQYDLFTVASHELLHVLGFGAAPSYFSHLDSGRFVGAHAQEAGSLTNPFLLLSADGGHWIGGTTGSVNGSNVPSVLTPSIMPGARLRPTDLDLAALEDIGWHSAIPGDANRDGIVEFSDAVSLIANYGVEYTGGWSKGDFNGDGRVEFSDAVSLVANYGASAMIGAIASPEESLTVVYHASSGELHLVGDVPGQLNLLAIDSVSQLFEPQNVLWSGESVTFSAGTAGHIGFATLTAAGDTFLAAGGQFLGKMLPPGISRELLMQELTVMYSLEGKNGMLYGNVEYVAAPEPISQEMWMMTFVVIGYIKLRRS